MENVAANKSDRFGALLSLAMATAFLLAAIPAPAAEELLPSPGSKPRVDLAGRVVLPALSFRPGPTSGRGIAPAHGVTPPFVDEQPIQGFSDLEVDGRGGLWVLSDNGFGSRDNSADYVLCIYHLQLDLDAGAVEVDEVVELGDPDGHAGFVITARRPPASGGEPVDPRIRRASLLTGADFDPESLARAPDGGFWVGDEFGPFLLHFDRQGRLDRPPVSTPGVYAPENPFLAARPPDQPSSGGFEGMDRSIDGSILYALLEKTTRGDPPGHLRLYRFDAVAGRFLHDEPYRFYPLEVPQGHYIGALAVIDTQTIAVLERDNEEGAAARTKKIYLADLGDHRERVLRKRELADLLRIPDPQRPAAHPRPPGPGGRGRGKPRHRGVLHALHHAGGPRPLRGGHPGRVQRQQPAVQLRPSRAGGPARRQ